MSSTKITKHDLDSSVMSKQTITLPVASWSNGSQSVSCTGVTANNTVVISPAPDSHTAYGEAGVKCTAQGGNSLTFTCDASSVPEVSLTVNVLIVGV